MLSRKDMLANASVCKCGKCKQSVQSGTVCINCGSVSYPSCARLLKYVKFVSDSQIICCSQIQGGRAIANRLKSSKSGDVLPVRYRIYIERMHETLIS